jgi:hypothetical protein
MVMMLSFLATLLTYASTFHGKLSRNVDERLFGSGWTRYTTRVKEHSPYPRKAVKTMNMSVGAFEFGLYDIVPTVIATNVIKETLISKSVSIYIDRTTPTANTSEDSAAVAKPS